MPGSLHSTHSARAGCSQQLPQAPGHLLYFGQQPPQRAGASFSPKVLKKKQDREEVPDPGMPVPLKSQLRASREPTPGQLGSCCQGWPGTHCSSSALAQAALPFLHTLQLLLVPVSAPSHHLQALQKHLLFLV